MGVIGLNLFRFEAVTLHFEGLKRLKPPFIGENFADKGIKKTFRFKALETTLEEKSSPKTRLEDLKTFQRNIRVFRNFLELKESDFQTVGSAYAEGNRFVLTPSERSQRGAIWYKKPIDLTKDYEFHFKMYLGDRTCGADGLAFVLQANGTDVLGGGGGNIGYGGISKSLAVEFDTWQNGDIGDPNGNHIGFNINGNIRSEYTYALPSPLESDREIEVDIVWDYKGNDKALLKVSVMGKVYTYEVESVSSLFGGYTAYFGFTSATGGEKNLHYVRDIKLSSQSNVGIERELTLSPSNTADNPVETFIGGTKVTSWVEEVEEGLYRIWFKLEASSPSEGSLTLLNRYGEKPKWVGGNPYHFRLGEGESVTQYWALVKEEEFPFKIRATLFEDKTAQPLPTTDTVKEKVALTHTVGSAYIEGDKIVLTPDENNRAGAVWSNTVVDLRRSFEVKFLLYAGSNPDGADGITFTLTPQNCRVGCGGGCLGICGLENSLSVEFDTWKNGFDINGNHISFVTNGSVASAEKSFPLPLPLESGREIPVTIRWFYEGENKATLEVEIFGKTYTYEVENFVSLFGSDKVFLGFTGATGGAKNLQYIRDFQFNYLPTRGERNSVRSQGGMIITTHVASLRAEHLLLLAMRNNLQWLRVIDPFYSTLPPSKVSVYTSLL